MHLSNKIISGLFLVLLTFFPAVLFSQSLNANWGQSSINDPNFIQTDASGNVFRTSFEDSILVKMDSDGNVLWAVDFPVQPNDSAAILAGLAIDANGNSYVVGSYQTTHISFGSTTLSADTSKGHSSLFLTTYDADGNFRWAITTAINSTASVNAIQVNNSGEIFLSGDIDTASATFGSTTLHSGVFHVKINPDKSIAWAKEIHSDDQIFAGGMDVDDSGNSIVTGNFTGTACSIGTTSLLNTNAATSDIFILQFDTNGDVQLSQTNGTSGNNDWVRGMAIAASGNLYITGTHEDFSLFIKAYDVHGNYLWENHYYHYPNVYYSSDLSVDAQENVYITGSFDGSEMDLDTITLSVSGTSNALFAVSFNQYGHLRWAGATDHSYGEHIVADASGKVYLTGGISGPTLTLGSIVLANRNTPISNSGFLAQLNQDNLTTGLFSSLAPQQSALVYPNPTSGNIHLSGLKAAQWKLNIYSMTGTSVYQTQFNASQVDVDMSAYPKGFYFYELQSDAEEMTTGKISLE
ncbi:MAG: C-terminal target protein [Chitinophagaceae bacterium]|nr:C-terminal target protein [Chitinophagaceae bacterium]